ncbi:TetR/AcrR family transcriptional regulator [Paracoccus sp. (in: a-proteobacteria)]|uniref:TetR/AcrR family transcriptional regulator n=1 Tax=Paracoccus sp. TaxID=267 RepID=UPI0028A8F62F|nr:TetR/AcrR family transcriptional regulator [Paracoccus sp. (in: a-proteobacteria)]
MDNNVAPETGWRGSREGWLEAGYQALIDSGVDAVKIQPLAKQLNLSRTSFYWFFGDREALLNALLEGWEARTTQPLVAATRQYAETQTEAMLNVLTCLLSDAFDSRLEFAVRSWALQDRKVAERIEVADAARLQALVEMLVAWGHDPAVADVRARTVYLVQIGYISMQAREDIPTRLERIPTYVEIYTGQSPEPREIARFNARFIPVTGAPAGGQVA